MPRNQHSKWRQLTVHFYFRFRFYLEASLLLRGSVIHTLNLYAEFQQNCTIRGWVIAIKSFIICATCAILSMIGNKLTILQPLKLHSLQIYQIRYRYLRPKYIPVTNQNCGRWRLISTSGFDHVAAHVDAYWHQNSAKSENPPLSYCDLSIFNLGLSAILKLTILTISLANYGLWCICIDPRPRCAPNTKFHDGGCWRLISTSGFDFDMWPLLQTSRLPNYSKIG